MADVVKKPSRVPFATSSEVDATDAETIEAIEADLPRIQAEAREAAQRFESEVVRHLCKVGLLDLPQVVATISSARIAKGATLDDVSQTAGIPIETLSDLEADTLKGPSLSILQRYAAAIGLRLVVDLTSSGAAGKSVSYRSPEVTAASEIDEAARQAAAILKVHLDQQ